MNTTKPCAIFMGYTTENNDIFYGGIHIIVFGGFTIVCRLLLSDAPFRIVDIPLNVAYTVCIFVTKK